MEALTRRQQEIFDFIVEMWRSSFRTPTLEEIANEFGYRSPTGARDHLLALERKGMIRREAGKARSIKITDPATLATLQNGGRYSLLEAEERGIPVLGQIAAGSPLEAIEHCDRFLPMPGAMFGRGEIFALEVRGESMVDLGICEGDLAIIAKRETVESGTIAAVIINGEATLKTVLRERRGLILRAANPAFADLVFKRSEAHSVRIAGEYLGLVRSEHWKEGLAA